MSWCKRNGNQNGYRYQGRKNNGISNKLWNNGDIISIVSNLGNVSVTVSGEAQSSGNLGDLIKVKNLKSGKIIKGYIKKNKKINIYR